MTPFKKFRTFPCQRGGTGVVLEHHRGTAVHDGRLTVRQAPGDVATLWSSSRPVPVGAHRYFAATRIRLASSDVAAYAAPCCSLYRCVTSGRFTVSTALRSVSL